MNKPMPLEDLPEYLKSAREGNTGSAPVVGMGRIVEPPQKSNWLQHSLVALLLFCAVGMGGMVAYNVMSPDQFTVIVDMNDPTSIQRIVSDSGGEIIAVKQNDEDTYEVQVSTRKSRRSFLDWIRGKRDVKRATLDQ